MRRLWTKESLLAAIKRNGNEFFFNPYAYKNDHLYGIALRLERDGLIKIERYRRDEVCLFTVKKKGMKKND